MIQSDPEIGPSHKGGELGRTLCDFSKATERNTDQMLGLHSTRTYRELHDTADVFYSVKNPSFAK